MGIRQGTPAADGLRDLGVILSQIIVVNFAIERLLADGEPRRGKEAGGDVHQGSSNSWSGILQG